MRISYCSSDGCSADLFGRILAGRRAVEREAVLGLLGDRLDVIGAPLRAPMVGDRLHFLVGDERPVDARDLLAAGHVEHVALAQQLLGALFAQDGARIDLRGDVERSEEHTSELQSLMRISYAVFCLKKKKN